jgi:electron transfer flavoprotein alpha subunit
MTTLVIAEHDNQQLAHNTLTTIGAAKKFNSSVSVLVIGYQCVAIAQEVACYEGVSDVIHIDDQVYEHQLAENIAKAIVQVAVKMSHILAPASTFGKNVLPRVAALLDKGQISEITEILNDSTFIRPIYAGNALETVESLDDVKIVTVRATAFAPVERFDHSVATIRQEKIVIENRQAQFINRQFTQSERPNLTEAKIVISGGRGLQNADNFKLLEQLANQLGAAIGASRAAVDAGFVPNDYQVGQTGKVVAPDLYIAVGISGAIQHLAGMKDSKVVVAINKDPEAPIFAVADYGLVGDLFKILPEVSKELSDLGYS